MVNSGPSPDANVAEVYGGIAAYWTEEFEDGVVGWEKDLSPGVLAALTPDEIEWFDKNWKIANGD